jgi:hypothetical protein
VDRKPENMSIVNNSDWNQYGDINVGGTVNHYYGDGIANQKKKRFTNKKLVVPFTKESSSGYQGGTYVQRDDLLRKISACFDSQKGQKCMVFLSGMGGCGKSELARAYADIHNGEYEEIFWLTCKDGSKPELFALMAEANTLCEVNKEDAYGFSDKVLLIVDNYNFDDPQFLFSISKSTGNADILVTTRRGFIDGYGDAMIPVESDDKEDFACSVFEKNYCRRSRQGKPKKIMDDDVACVREICREVQYNTMIISMIGIRLRDYDDLCIPECARKIRNSVGSLRGRVRYSKDQDTRSEEIRDILEFLFSDILNHRFTDEEKAILTVLSLFPASWYAGEYVISLCKGVQTEPEYKDALMDLLDLGWLQGNAERIAVHPLVAEVLSGKQIIAIDPVFFEGLVVNYLGMPSRYLGKEIFLINKILKMADGIKQEARMASMLLINHGGYRKLAEEILPDVKAAYFVFANHAGMRHFMYRDLVKKETSSLIDVSCQEKEGKQAELLRIIKTDDSYELDLNIDFCGKCIEEIPDGLCWSDLSLRRVSFSKSLKCIRSGAFYGCSGLSGELKLPEGLTSIGSYAFYGCSGLSGELKLPEGLTSIGDRAFYGCSGLSGELKLPESLTSIGDNAFLNCCALEKLISCNPHTEIAGALNLYSSMVICGYRNSTAEVYAREHGLVFEEFEE